MNSLKQLRSQHKVTAKEICWATGIAISTISRIEKGHNRATATTIGKLADFFKVEVEYFADILDDSASDRGKLGGLINGQRVKEAVADRIQNITEEQLAAKARQNQRLREVAEKELMRSYAQGRKEDRPMDKEEARRLTEAAGGVYGPDNIYGATGRPRSQAKTQEPLPDWFEQAQAERQAQEAARQPQEDYSQPSQVRPFDPYADERKQSLVQRDTWLLKKKLG
jgi:transcriptional regulator with XRE-family HTH domain